jgi:hypothetical protein
MLPPLMKLTAEMGILDIIPVPNGNEMRQLFQFNGL